MFSSDLCEMLPNVFTAAGATARRHGHGNSRVPRIEVVVL